MQFLTRFTPGDHLMLLNILYYDPHDFKKDDVLMIVYKNMDTDEIYVENIKRPKIEVWIVKPEYRNTIGRISRDYYKEIYMEPYIFPYRSRYISIAKVLGLSSADEAKRSPCVAGSNVDIRDFYACQFQLEYGNDLPKKLNVGFLDIENDTIELKPGVFPKYGECPINMVTYIDEPTLTCYTFVLKSSGPTDAIDPDTGRAYDNREQQKYVQDHLDEFIQELHDDFDDKFGHLNYNIIFFNREDQMIKSVFMLLNNSDCDFCEIWNEAYDLSNFVARPNQLFCTAESLICDPNFEVNLAEFHEDRNPIVHKKKHDIFLSTRVTFIDQMIMYAGKRSGGGKIPSLKLNAIAKTVLNDSKLDYSEEGDIRTIAYKNFAKALKYNIKDVLLQLAIHRKTRDIYDIYERMSSDGLLNYEVFTSTVQLTNTFTIFLKRNGYIIGNNRNKFGPPKSTPKETIELDPEAYTDISDINPDDIDEYEEEDDDDEESTNSNSKRKKNYEGALVLNPNRTMSTGYSIGNKENAKIHNHVVDEDLRAEYPNAMRIQNASNETMIGQIVIPNDRFDYFARTNRLSELTIGPDGEAILTPQQEEEYKFKRFPMNDLTFIDDDKEKYNLNTSEMFCNELTQKTPGNFCRDFFNLPVYLNVNERYKEKLRKKLASTH